MTEAEWLAAMNPIPMIGHLRHHTTHRKILLVAAAATSLLADNPATRTIAEGAERFADGLTELKEIREQWHGGHQEGSTFPERPFEWAMYQTVLYSDKGLLHVAIIRDIVGNPFCPMPVDPSWRTSTVVALAGGIYAERAFDRMPILADALQDAGCENADVLNHCRGDGVHVRGCWVVDLLLGKA